jgi:glycerol-1-phosphate dehydrogenase [NAD(P)+]
MFYKEIKIPPIIEIQEDVIGKIDTILKKNHLYFEEKILITSSFLFELYQKEIKSSDFAEVVFIEGGRYEEIYELHLTKQHSDILLIAFGGGSVIDLVKIYATKHNIPYITLPSILSNDAIYSPVARLLKRGKKQSFGVTPPIGIIVDVNIICRAPEIYTLAGIGDLVSNLSAVKDYKLAAERDHLHFDSFAMTLSSLSANSVLSYTQNDIKNKAFIEQLAMGLISSGLAMVMASSSSPVSGSEHLISHAIDELFPEEATLHGLQVAFGQLFVEKYVRNNMADYNKLMVFYRTVGILDELSKKIHFTVDEMKAIIAKAQIIRNRYTILHECNGGLLSEMDYDGFFTPPLMFLKFIANILFLGKCLKAVL